MTRPLWLDAAARRWGLTAVVLGALLARLLVWRLLGGPIIRGDGVAYIEWAQRLAVGDFSGFQDYPLHQLYPILIAPAFLTGAPLEPFLLVLHMALSVGTVVCVYYACRQFARTGVALAAASIAAAYPALLFWSPYVLSETPFFFFLSLFLASLARVLARHHARARGPLAIVAVTGGLLLIARPVSVAVLGVGVVAVTYVLLADALGARRARILGAAGILVAVLAATALFSIDTPLRHQVLRYPTVAQSLWLSTRLSSSSFSEWAVVSAEHRTLVDRFAGDQDALWDYKLRDALDFIRAQPGTYALMAARRFTSYWLPVAFADGWSTNHRLFDLLLSAALALGTIVSLYGRRDVTRWTLLAAALALGILTSFSQIDTDGRYRVPAELILIPLAADGYVRLLVAGQARWPRRG